MKKNTSIKFLTAMVVGIVVLIFVNSRQAATEPNHEKNDPNNLNEAIASQFNDNIRDVSARLLETEKKMQAIEQNNKVMNTIPSDESKLNLSSELLASIDKLKEEFEAMKASRETASFSLNTTASKSSPHIKDIDALLIKHHQNPQEEAYWAQFKPSIKPIEKAKPTETSKAIPYYTIPAGSDLANSTLLSSLIGEVPVDGKLMQPLFPFTAIISRGDLMSSNGVPLPDDISGMKVSGYAIGVGSFLDDISCVRAYVTSALFTFQDGHFVTIGHEHMTNTTDLVNNESLGYLTTPFGNPCIHGKYFTNAPRVLTAMLASGGVQGLGGALSEWQMGALSNPNEVTHTPTSAFIPYAAGNALATGSIKTADWLEKRIQGSFDMVFVPASIGHHPNHVSLHLTQTIELDKKPNGRRLDYAHLQTYTHDFNLR